MPFPLVSGMCRTVPLASSPASRPRARQGVVRCRHRLHRCGVRLGQVSIPTYHLEIAVPDDLLEGVHGAPATRSAPPPFAQFTAVRHLVSCSSSREIHSASTREPRAMSTGLVHSSGLWLRPLRLGTSTRPAGMISFIT